MKQTDNGRTKFNKENTQFEQTGQKSDMQRDLPEGQQSKGNAPDQSPLERFDTPRNPRDEASQTGHGFVGKSEFGGAEHNAPKKAPKSGVERKGGA